MSRIAKQPIPLPDGVHLTQQENAVTVSGPNGELTSAIPSKLVTITEQDGQLRVTAGSEEQQAQAASGLVRSVLANLVHGATQDFVRELEFTGVGYRAQAQGQTLTLSMGYSHPVEMTVPGGVTASVQRNTIRLTGADAHAVGQFAAQVRAVRPPEPYKGKGIRYAGEQIRRKAGKAGKAGS